MRHSLDPDEVPEEARLYRVAFPELRRKSRGVLRALTPEVAAVILMALFLALAVLA